MGAKKSKLITITPIDPPGATAVPEAYREILGKLIAERPFLATNVRHARANLAEAIALERFGAPVQSTPFAAITKSGRIFAALRDGGANECLKIGRFDIGGPVEYAEFPGAWRATDYNLAPDAEHFVWVDKKNAHLIEGTFATGKQNVIWEPDYARMSSYSYDYMDPDRVLLVIGIRTGGCEAHLIERREGAFETVAKILDANCETVEPVPPFAFLFDAKGKRGKLLATNGAKLFDLGPIAFPQKPEYLSELDGQIIFGDEKPFRVDGPWEAYRSA